MAQATVHLMIRDDSGLVVTQTGRYRIACDPSATWAESMTEVPWAASCPACKASAAPANTEPTEVR